MMLRRKSEHARYAALKLGASFLLLFASSSSLPAQTLPRFEDYRVPLYRGAIHPSKWVQHVGGEWRDKLGKWIGPPEVNFAGKYFMALHSCGTGCRYYTLTDLASGRDLDVLDMFATAEPPPKTRYGREYLTELFSRADSKILVAQYHIGLYQEGKECRERVFLFEAERLKPITSTLRSCRQFGQ